MKIGNQKIIDGLAVFSAGYLKRWLETHLYDKIFETEIGKKFKSLGTREKYTIEAGLNLLTVFFDQKLSTDSAVKKLIKQVGTDIAPELSSRLVGEVKDHIRQTAAVLEEKELAKVLAELDDQVLTDLLKWLKTVSGAEREKVLRLFKELNGEEVARLAKLPPSLFHDLVELFGENSSAGRKDSVTAAMNRLNEGWEHWLNSKKGGK
jgi:hypothetical protein